MVFEEALKYANKGYPIARESWKINKFLCYIDESHIGIKDLRHHRANKLMSKVFPICEQVIINPHLDFYVYDNDCNTLNITCNIQEDDLSKEDREANDWTYIILMKGENK